LGWNCSLENSLFDDDDDDDAVVGVNSDPDVVAEHNAGAADTHGGVITRRDDECRSFCESDEAEVSALVVLLSAEGTYRSMMEVVCCFQSTGILYLYFES
jgi:hypothetical protein